MTTTQTPTARPHTPARTSTPPSPASSPPPKPPAPSTPSPQVNRSQLLAHLYDPDFHTLRLCDLHKLSVADLADELHAEQIIHAIEAAQRIVELRLSLIRAEAELAAWARLHDLAANFPTTPRDRETARKAASHILRERRADKPNPPTSREKSQASETTSREGGRQGAEARPPQSPTSTQPTQRAPSVRDGVIHEPTSREGGRQGAEARPPKDPAPTPTTPPSQTTNLNLPNHPINHEQAPTPPTIPCVRSFPVATGSPPTPPPSAPSAFKPLPSESPIPNP